MPENQTMDQWLVERSRLDRGTGIFLRASGRPKEFMTNVTYDDFLFAATQSNFFAIKWVPFAVATERQLQQMLCGEPCTTHCVKPACICDRPIGKCV